MSTLCEGFTAALLDPNRPVPAQITSWNGSDPAQRFAVYRNNVTVSLIEALGASFPTVRAMVGEDFFRDMAREFLRRNPPRSPVMMRYGAGFAEFLAAFPPLAEWPYLPDLARLDAARLRAYHAADGDSLAPDAFSHLGEDDLAGTRIALHPSVEILSSPYAIASLWGAHQGAIEIEAVDPFAPEEVLVVRPHFEVLVLRLPPGGAGFFSALANGAPLGEVASAQPPGFPLSHALSLLVTHGLAVALNTP